MLLALTVAVLAVALGLALGLTPRAGRRALGPLRTLAFTAVVAVVALHLLPEALLELKALGLIVFAVGLALPRWLAAFGREHDGAPRANSLGLELGFWGLVIHHIGDGLALGAYVRVARESGHRNFDVLLALVLHTVPLVAVVAAGYARTRGRRSAVLRSAELAAASVLGVLLAGSVPAELVADAQAWIAAGVSGLLLHGLTHDLERDLPADGLDRGFDLLMVFFGVALGWLGVALDRASEPDALVMGPFFSTSIERAAPALLIGLLLGSIFDAIRRAPTSAARAALQRGLGAEPFLLTMSHLGWLFAITRDALILVALALSPSSLEPRADTPAEAPEPARAGLLRWLAHLDARVDSVIGWGLVGVLVSGVIEATIPSGALQTAPWLALAAVLLFTVSVPVHAVAAPVIGFALYSKGLPAAATLLFVVLSPLRSQRAGLKVVVAVVVVTLGSFLVGPFVVQPALALNPVLARAFAAVLLTLGVRRAYRLGFRALLRPVLADHDCAASAHEHAAVH